MKAEEIAGPSVDGAARFWSTCTSPITVPMIPIVGAKPPAFSNGIAPSWWRAIMPSISASRMSRTSSGSEPSTTSWSPLRVKSSSISEALESSANSPSRRACSAKPTSCCTRALRSISGGPNTSLYSVGMRFIAGIPQLASVAPPVPQMMIKSAGMSMKAAGLVPPIIADMSIPPAARPMPMADAGFISSPTSTAARISSSRLLGLADGVDRKRGGAGLAQRHHAAQRAPLLAELVAAQQRLGEDPRPVVGDLLGDALGRLGDDDLLPVDDRQHRVRRRLDGDDHVRVDLEGVHLVAQAVRGDHGLAFPGVGVVPADGGEGDGGGVPRSPPPMLRCDHRITAGPASGASGRPSRSRSSWPGRSARR